MPVTAQKRKLVAKRIPPQKRIPTRTLIEPTRNFTPEEAAFAASVAVVTVRRAIALNQVMPNQGLSHYRIGRRIVISGEQIQNWIASGGQTGRSIDDVIREKREAEARRTK